MSQATKVVLGTVVGALLIAAVLVAQLALA